MTIRRFLSVALNLFSVVLYGWCGWLLFIMAVLLSRMVREIGGV